ncbi:MAG: class I SAM-dependent methyltransferase [Bacillota bacterium]|nr:class I SAM-dependent methyltransferase [Bacillota bacterium]
MSKKNGFSVWLLKSLNRLFPQIVHPFNLQNRGEQTYAQWQFEKGADTIACYTERFSPEEMFRGKAVLDMGCGASGKSLYYLSIGAKSVTGVDVVEHYKTEAEAFADSLGYRDRFHFVLGDAVRLPFDDNSFDTVTMKDFIEHVSNPEGALRESLRILKPGGRAFINFPPYYHPTGAHMSDVIGIPWVHLFFSEGTLIAAYKDLIRGLPDEEDRISLRIHIDENREESLGYINKMTLGRFHRILGVLHITPFWYKEIPLRGFLKPLARFPLTKEMFVKMGVCVIEKPKA